MEPIQNLFKCTSLSQQSKLKRLCTEFQLYDILEKEKLKRHQKTNKQTNKKIQGGQNSEWWSNKHSQNYSVGYFNSWSMMLLIFQNPWNYNKEQTVMLTADLK